MNTNIFFSTSVILCLLLQGAEAEIVEERQKVVPGLCEDFYDNCSELSKGGGTANSLKRNVRNLVGLVGLRLRWFKKDK